MADRYPKASACLLAIIFMFALWGPLTIPARAAETVPGDSCGTAPFVTNTWQMAGGKENGGVVNGMFCDGSSWRGIISFLSGGDVGIDTAHPAAPLHVNGEAIVGYTGLACNSSTQGAIRYNSSIPTIEFCDGSNWRKVIGDQSGYNPTAPSGSGYFVLTQSTYNANMGGVTGVDSKCLTELTTNTNWKGYSTANANGQLIASKVHGFVGNQDYLMPITTYSFARVGDSTVGGATFTTDSSGSGPNDYADWAAANYFSVSAYFWTAITQYGSTSDTNWTNAWDGNNCYNFTTSTSAGTAQAGYSAATNRSRWTANLMSCDTLLPIVCYVNP